MISIASVLLKPSRQNFAALILPACAFAAVSALSLIVLSGGLSFFSISGEVGGFYQFLASLAMILLVVPLISVGTSAARLAARRRDTNLSTLRLLGATSATLTWLTVLESVLAAGIGVLGGLLIYLLTSPLISMIHFNGAPIGAGYWPHPLVIVGVVFAVLLLAVLSAVAGLRKVVVTPLGVRTRAKAAASPWLRAVVGGVVVLVCVVVANSLDQSGSMAAALLAILFMFGASFLALNLLGPWLVRRSAMRELRKAERAERLLSARAILEDPKTAWQHVAGISVISFVAVFAGTGVSALNSMASEGVSDADMLLAHDMQTGLLITVIGGFVTVAAAAAINQAAYITDRRELFVSLHRLGMQPAVMNAARTRTVMLPLIAVALGSALIAGLLIFPLAGFALVFAPLSVATIAGSVLAGVMVVRLCLLSGNPVLQRVLENPVRAGI